VRAEPGASCGSEKREAVVVEFMDSPAAGCRVETKWVGGAGLATKGTRLSQSFAACQWMRAISPKVMAG
jgi:hypothetical protein